MTEISDEWCRIVTVQGKPVLLTRGWDDEQETEAITITFRMDQFVGEDAIAGEVTTKVLRDPESNNGDPEPFSDEEWTFFCDPEKVTENVDAILGQLNARVTESQGASLH